MHPLQNISPDNSLLIKSSTQRHDYIQSSRLDDAHSMSYHFSHRDLFSGRNLPAEDIKEEESKEIIAHTAMKNSPLRSNSLNCTTRRFSNTQQGALRELDNLSHFASSNRRLSITASLQLPGAVNPKIDKDGLIDDMHGPFGPLKH